MTLIIQNPLNGLASSLPTWVGYLPTQREDEHISLTHIFYI